MSLYAYAQPSRSFEHFADYWNGFDELMDDEFDSLLEESLDEGKRGRPRLSDELTTGQKGEIRRLATVAAEKRGHRTRQRGSRRGRHQQGVSTRARAIERSALRRVDDGTTYQSVLRYLHRLIESFDEFEDNDWDSMDWADGAAQNSWYFWDAWHKPPYRDFVYRGRQGPESLPTMSALSRGTQFAEQWRRQTWDGHLYIERFILNGQQWVRDRCNIWDAQRNTWTGC